MSQAEMMKVINKVIKSLEVFSKAKKRTFLFVYVAGHGIADAYQWFVTNAPTGNQYPLEANLRGYVRMLGNYCTIFATYDMCRSEKELYKDLTTKAVKKEVTSSRGTGEVT